MWWGLDDQSSHLAFHGGRSVGSSSSGLRTSCANAPNCLFAVFSRSPRRLPNVPMGAGKDIRHGRGQILSTRGTTHAVTN